MVQTIRFWLNNARKTSLPQSILPAVLAVSMAYKQSDFSWLYALLGVAGVIIGHLGVNLFDDYFDYRKKETGYRQQMAREGMRARIAKCEYLTSGKATLNQLLAACIVFCAVALAIGLIIFLGRGNVILYFMLITAGLGFFYSGPPLRLSYRGLGELQTGLMFGPLLMGGVYYAACGKLDVSLYFISIPIGLLVANILYTHSIMDYEPDRKVGKMTLAVLLKSKKAMLFVLALFLFASYFLVFYGVFARFLSPYYLLTALTLPMAVSLIYLMIQFVKNPYKKFSPRFWMGPMSNWERVEKNGISWFMLRWYLARNLLSFLCLIILIVNCIVS
ncbi:1 4-dihydroxy-2-naphthoate octaprenyltransferase [termite gut metagenome]|uniref:1 4-dihydroxy-2-naphthoate octaprenyltransferase n=1 Tax=termite gut metagenome TaxID=433724 RepID=A0A5J4T0C3_9ZZZZ